MRDETDLIVHDTDEGQSDSTGGLDAARKVAKWYVIVKRHRERYRDRDVMGRIFQYSYEEQFEHQAWLALQRLEESLDELCAALETAGLSQFVFVEFAKAADAIRMRSNNPLNRLAEGQSELK